MFGVLARQLAPVPRVHAPSLGVKISPFVVDWPTRTHHNKLNDRSTQASPKPADWLHIFRVTVPTVCHVHADEFMRLIAVHELAATPSYAFEEALVFSQGPAGQKRASEAACTYTYPLQ
jgi:hypothetical protein